MNCLYEFSSSAEQEALGVAMDMQAQHQQHAHAAHGAQYNQQLAGYTMTGSSPSSNNNNNTSSVQVECSLKRDDMFMVSRE